MMQLSDPYPIVPLAKPPNCTITVPGSKSITNRALILAALAKGKCTLRGALWADDTQVMVDSLQKLGFEVTVEPDPAEECNRMITVVGRDGEIPAKKAELYVGNAGTAARFLTALVCLGHGEYKILGDPRMHERPMKELFDALRSLGAKIDSVNDRLPASIHSRGLRKGTVTISTERSSQFLSALLLLSNRIQLGTVIANVDGEAESYVTMTHLLREHFINSGCSDFLIEPDMSSGSYFAAVSFLFQEQGGKVEVSGRQEIPVPHLQIDSDFPVILRNLFESAPPEFRVSRARDLGDSVMTLAICALFGKQPMRLIDASRLREQETDRLKAMVTELQRVGAEADEHEDGFTVWPAKPGQLHGADIETYNDHRMAMCFSVLGLKVPGIRIKNPQCVSKTFPNFFEKLEQLRQ